MCFLLLFKENRVVPISRQNMHDFFSSVSLKKKKEKKSDFDFFYLLSFLQELFCFPPGMFATFSVGIGFSSIPTAFNSGRPGCD